MRSERGNIVVYLLVGLVLFGLLISGIWWVKRQAGSSLKSPVATQNAPAKPSTDTKVSQDEKPTQTDPEKPANSPENTPASNDGGQTGQSAPSTATPTPPSNTPTTAPSSGTSSSSTITPSVTPPSSQTVPNQNASPVVPARPESQTPHVATTGPSSVASSGPLEDMIVSSVLIGGVVFAVTSYARSRRTLSTN